MLEYAIDIHALAGDFPNRLAESAHLLGPGVVFGRADGRHLSPAFELVAIDDAFGAERHDKVAFLVVGHDANGVGAGGGAKLYGHRAEATRGAPYEHIVARLQGVRPMTEQHAVGGGECQRVAGSFFPSEMLRSLEQLTVLHAAKLRERAVWRLVAPDALRRREHGIAAVAFLVVTVVLVTVDDDLVTDFPAFHLGANCPHDAGGVRASDVKRVLVPVERRDRL